MITNQQFTEAWMLVERETRQFSLQDFDGNFPDHYQLHGDMDLVIHVEFTDFSYASERRQLMCVKDNDRDNPIWSIKRRQKGAGFVLEIMGDQSVIMKDMLFFKMKHT